jgi:glycosyltransferase involved in cell wall biosynthesis
MIPLITVVIPLYNKEKSIARAISSVLNQSEQNFEIIVVNDGSTDGSADIVRSLSAGNKLRLIDQDNAGPSAARNRGVQEARADLVAFLDADDEWHAQFLETILALHSQVPQAGVYAAMYYFKGNNGKLRLPASYNLFERDWIGEIRNYFAILCLVREDFPFNTSSTAVTKKALQDVGGFPLGVGFGEDIDTWIRLSLSSKIVFINKPLAVYHLEAENRACKDERDPLDVIYPVKHLAELLSSGAVPAELRQSAREYIEKWQLDLAKTHLQLGKNLRAKELIVSSPRTKRYMKTRLLWLLCSYLPPSLFLSMLALRRRFLGVLPDR